MLEHELRKRVAELYDDLPSLITGTGAILDNDAEALALMNKHGETLEQLWVRAYRYFHFINLPRQPSLINTLSKDEFSKARRVGKT